MTQTPASGPLGPVTTPPMSSASMLTAAPPGCWASSLATEPAYSPAIATAATPNHNALFVVVIGATPFIASHLSPRGDGIIPRSPRLRRRAFPPPARLADVPARHLLYPYGKGANNDHSDGSLQRAGRRGRARRRIRGRGARPTTAAVDRSALARRADRDRESHGRAGP